MTTTETFTTMLQAAMEQERSSPVGRRFTAAGFTLEHNGGGCTVWQLIDPALPKLLVWVSLSENPDPIDEIGNIDDEPALWTCGVHNLDDDGMMTDKDGECEDVRGVSASIEWCHAQLALLSQGDANA